MSAGYDYAAGDPVGDLDVDGPLAARLLAQLIREVAETYAAGRVVYCLEGGYDIATLARSVEETVRVHDAPSQSSESADPTSIGAPQRAILERVAAWSS